MPAPRRLRLGNERSWALAPMGRGRTNGSDRRRKIGGQSSPLRQEIEATGIAEFRLKAQSLVPDVVIKLMPVVYLCFEGRKKLVSQTKNLQCRPQQMQSLAGDLGSRRIALAKLCTPRGDLALGRSADLEKNRGGIRLFGLRPEHDALPCATVFRGKFRRLLASHGKAAAPLIRRLKTYHRLKRRARRQVKRPGFHGSWPRLRHVVLGRICGSCRIIDPETLHQKFQISTIICKQHNGHRRAGHQAQPYSQAAALWRPRWRYRSFLAAAIGHINWSFNRRHLYNIQVYQHLPMVKSNLHHKPERERSFTVDPTIFLQRQPPASFRRHFNSDPCGF